MLNGVADKLKGWFSRSAPEQVPEQLPQLQPPKLPGPRPLEDAIGQGRSRVPHDVLCGRIAECAVGKYAMFKSFMQQVGAYKGQRLIIVGGGTSIKDTIPDIKAKMRRDTRYKLLAVNKSHDFLINEHGFRPGKDIHFGCMCDPADWVAGYMTPDKRIKYWLASQLDDAVFDKFVPFREQVYIWNADVKQPDGSSTHRWTTENLPQFNLPFITVGVTVGIMSVFAAAAAGFDDVELHGFDSCYHPDGGELHAYAKPQTNQTLSDATVTSRTTGNGFRFVSNLDMAMQALDFGRIMERLSGDFRMKIRVAGYGVIPWLVWQDGGKLFSHATPWKMAERFGDQKNIDYRPQWCIGRNQDQLTTEPLCPKPTPQQHPHLRLVQ